jgi:hypothetical protein
MSSAHVRTSAVAEDAKTLPWWLCDYIYRRSSRYKAIGRYQHELDYAAYSFFCISLLSCIASINLMILHFHRQRQQPVITI